MQAIVILFVVLAVGSALWSVAASLMIYDNLRKRGEKVNFLLLRMLAPWYATRYRDITRKESGSVGALYYHWMVPINMALLFAVLALVVHFIGK